jgi:valyl-tRNA synthetase
MDEGFSKAVIKVFVDLYNQGLLYRDKRLVNWDPGLKTAISDLEVETREINGKFWHFKYPLEDGSGFISVATTRPETMLADMAVAVNPSDARYAHLVGKNVRLPITGRLIPIITDEHADPALGSGAVKITPGHDFNDFEVGKRAGFKASEMLNMLDSEGRVVQTARDPRIPAEYIGQYRFGIEGEPTNARKMVVEAMDALGLVEKVEDRVIQTPFGDRSGQVIEPWLTDQWYVDAATLAKPAIEAARKGKANGGFDIVPKSWEKTYFNWMENIQPWCVSRQLWWGHRIPVWYGPATFTTPNGPRLTMDYPSEENRLSGFTQHEIFVCETEAKAIEAAAKRYTEAGVADNYEKFEIVIANSAEHAVQLANAGQIPLWRDPDVLDTWFSSALWPFGTLGWPEALSSPSTCDGEGDRREAVVEGTATSKAPPSSEAGASAATSPSQVDGEEENPLHQPAAGPPPRAGEESLLQRHYPNDVLISGFDILFFWDARMAMQGIHFMKEVPWKTLYLHGLVRAADGSKMSKSKGNTVDPLGLIDQYGADALRFFMAAMESQGRDIKMDESRVAGYRNFATKLWNAARFAQSNGISGSHSVHAPKAELAVNRWIIGEVVETVEKLNKAFAEYRFDGMADVLYHFVFDQFCDWYLELIKPLVQVRPGEGRGPDAVEAGPRSAPGNAEADETREVAGWALDQILVMLHPFMPFITEELWHALADPDHPRAYDIIHAQWPEPNATVDAEAIAENNWVIDTISKTRSFKAELNIAPGTRLTANIADPQSATVAVIHRQGAALARLGRIDKFVYSPVKTNNVAQIVVGDDTIVFELDGVIDLDAERNRITKAIEAATKERDALAGRLSNAAFVEKAKPEAVEKARADHAEKAAEVERLTAARKRLG